VIGKAFARPATLARIAMERLRASWLRLLGMQIGAKSGFGPRTVVRRPWCIRVGERVWFEHNVYLKLVADSARLEIGDRAWIGTGTEFDVSKSVVVGAHSQIAPNVFITDHTHNSTSRALIEEQGIAEAPVTIGRDVWIGTGSVILHGVTIGDGAVIGARSVVNRDVAPYTIVAGAPARVIGERK
jgi:acetyltransferase-like isoleucine patch superfamily enzyme